MEDDDDYLPDFLKEDSVVESPFGLDDMVMPSDYEWTYLHDDYSVEGIKNARLGSLFIKLTSNQKKSLDKIRAKLYNWDSEPSYSDIFHKEFCKTEGVSLSVLKTLEKKGLIKLSKGDAYYFKERGYIVYPKPLMYAFYITEEDDYPDWFIPEAKEKGLWKAESKKMNPLEKAGITGVASGATMEGLETLMAAESFSAEKEKRSKYMEFIYDMFYTPGSDAYKIREERVLPKDGTYQLASQLGLAFDKRQRPFDSVLHNNLKGLSMTSQPYYYHIPYKGKLFVFSYIVKGRGRLKRGYLTYYPPDSQYGEEQICGIETKHGDDCYCYQKNYKAESFKGEGTLEPCPHDAGIDSEEVSWLGEGDGVVHITGRCRDCSAEGEGYVQIEFEDGERWKDEMAAEKDEDFMGWEYYFLVDTDGNVTNDFSSLKDAQIALSYVPNRNLKIMRRRFDGKNMAGTTTEVTEFDPYKTPNYFKNNYHSEGEGLSEKQLRDYFARVKDKNPKLAKEIEYSIKEQGYVSTENITKAGFNPSHIEAWADLVADEEKYAPLEPCPECEGEGYVLTSYTSATRFDPADGDGEDCGECGGTGEIDPADYMYSNDGEVDYLAETFEAKDDSWCVNHGWIHNTKIGDIIPCTSCNDKICDGCRCGGCGNCENADCCECKNAEEKSITPYLLGVGIVGILGYAFTRKL